MWCVLYFDTETTGLPRRRNALPTDFEAYDSARVVELAWQLRADERVLRSEQHLVYPEGFDIGAFVTGIHGVSTEMAITYGEPVSDVLSSFAKAVAMCDEIVAHNLDFDQGVVLSENARLEHPFSALSRAFDTKRLTCTMKGTKDIVKARGQTGVIKWPRLSELYFHCFGKEPPDQHTALGDVTAMADCVRELKTRGISIPACNG